jgi:hypothetical protein
MAKPAREKAERPMGDEREFKILITGDAGGIVAAGKQGAGALKEVKAEITDGVNPALANMTAERGQTRG